MVDSIAAVSVWTRCALIHSVWDLKAAQINVQRTLIRELVFYEFKLGHNATEVTKNICAKSGGLIDHSTVIRWFKKFLSGCKNLDDQTRLSRFKIVDSEAIVQAIEENLVSNSRRVSGELGISQTSVVRHLHVLGKSTRRRWIVPHVTKILQNFWLTLVFLKVFSTLKIPTFYFSVYHHK